jgi:hypothetical protein
MRSLRQKTIIRKQIFSGSCNAASSKPQNLNGASEEKTLKSIFESGFRHNNREETMNRTGGRGSSDKRANDRILNEESDYNLKDQQSNGEAYSDKSEFL